MLCLSVTGLAHAQLGPVEPPFDPQIHWAYSSFLGTGWYKISNERDGFVLRLTPRWRIGETRIHESGKRQIEYTFRVPVTLGVTRFEFDDILGSLDNLVNASVNFGVDADIPVSDTFFVKPLVQVGYGTVLDQDESAVTYSAELRARKEFPRENFDWALMGGLGYAGYTPKEGRSDDFSYFTVATEFTYPIGWRLSPTDQSVFHWHIGYTEFVDDIQFDFRRDETTPVGNFWQLGFGVGLKNEKVKIWALKFDRLGLAYNYSRQGELRGIKVLFTSIYDF